MKTRLLILLASILIFSPSAKSGDELLHHSLREHFYKAGPGHYITGLDDTVKYNQISSAFIESGDSIRDAEGEQSHAALLEYSYVEAHQGKRIKFSAHIKAEEVDGQATTWLSMSQDYSDLKTKFKSRKQRLKGKWLSYAKLEDNTISGSTDWVQYSLVLDVPENAHYIAFGALLSGSGKIWINNLQFSIVGDDVPVTEVSEEHN